ncbi:unnamed protein product [Thelazia callipaeda]|uniref:ECR1_N domain-containing protein n=1 Tax=Thelazia callipaeda TaxID=103827 RepID=A0A0N5CKQ8_THECL|nr:unnamed protein product [Thelazia callipaeda]
MDVVHDSNGIEESENKFVIPGDRLFPITEFLKAGIGTYELFGHIYASLAGNLHLHVNEEDSNTKVVEVRQKSEKEQGHVMPYVGCVVTGKVQNIGHRFAKCTIHCIECSHLSHEFSGILRKGDIIPHENEKTKLPDYVQPGDVILARVIGFGDNQRSYLLSIAEEELGVVSSIGDFGERMVPYSLTEVKSTLTGTREKRKVAHVPDLNQ